MLFPVRPPWLLTRFLNRYTWRIPESSDRKTVYLTFDDGPVPQHTGFVLDVLKEYGAQATFFCIGENAARHPELIERILASGHSLGNHTYHHLNGWKTPLLNYLADIEKAAEVIPSNLFRPPYGRINMKQGRCLLEKYRVIMWDVLSYDFETSETPERCYKNVINYTRPGSIVVFHDSAKAAPNLEKTLPAYLDFLKNEGYECRAL